MLEQISWIYSYSENNWWTLAIISIILLIISGLMYAWLDDTCSVTYAIVTLIGYVLHLFIGLLAVIAFVITVVGTHPNGKPI